MNSKYPKCCKNCFNEGLYTCKMILLEDGSCMFYSDEENPIFEIINNEDKQKTSYRRSERSEEVLRQEQEIA